MTDVVQQKNFEEMIAQGKHVVRFHSQWNNECRYAEKPYKEIKTELSGRINFIDVDINTNPKMASVHMVSRLPSIILFNNGMEVKRLAGLMTKRYIKQEIERFI